MTIKKNPEEVADLWPEGNWFLDRGSPVDLIAVEKHEVLVQGRTIFQEYEIFVNRLWGRTLILDGRLQSAEIDEFVYHEALVHPAMVAHPDPQRVLVMGGGEGATLREVLRHPQVKRAVMVDIDAELVKVCRQWLPTFHRGSFDDPRAELVFADGRAWLAEQPDGAFDIIILDLPEPLEEGPALRLFTREMYELVRRKLAPGGLMSVQSGSAGVLARMFLDIHATLRAVFPQVVPYTAFVTSFMDLYGFNVAGGEELNWPSAKETATRLSSRGLTSLGWYEPEFAAGLPHLPLYLKDSLARKGRVLTDAEPYGPFPGERTFY
jgi:spermidine synthase